MPRSFYPTAWHDIVSLALTVTGGQDVVAATNAMILVSGAIIWPAGCLLLTHVAFPFTRISTLVAGILTCHRQCDLHHFHSQFIQHQRI